MFKLFKISKRRVAHAIRLVFKMLNYNENVIENVIKQALPEKYYQA